MKKKSRQRKYNFRHNFRYNLYRLQQRVAITNREARALWVLLSFLVLGMIVSEIQKNRPAFSTDDYAELDSLFLDATASLKAGASTIPASPGPAGDSSARPTADSLIAFFKPPFPVNINTAEISELEKLPRIGPKMAERIIAYRENNGPFNRKTDLMQVKGIGEKTFEQLADKITVD